jgi:hypothetical protein
VQARPGFNLRMALGDGFAIKNVGGLPGGGKKIREQLEFPWSLRNKEIGARAPGVQRGPL